MIVTWLGHASLFLNAAGKTLLVDPWFIEPVDGKYRFPPPPYAVANAMPRPDFLLLTCARNEHASEATLSQLKRDTVTLAAPEVLPRLSALQFNKVKPQEPWSSTALSPGLSVTFVPGGAFVVEADDVRLFHGGDAALSADDFREVARRAGPIDMAFLPFTADDKQRGLQRFFEGIVGLQAKEAAPFASGWLRLENVDSHFAQRATHAEALAAAMKLAHENGTHLAHLQSGDEWSPETGAINKGLVDGWSEDVASLHRYAAQLSRAS